jgi:putative membrane protein insertion efficiency factor
MSAARHAAWVVGAPARWILIGGIHLYRLTLSHALGNQCRFEPSCSHYAEQAIRARGALAGTAFAVWRILRCNPYGGGGVDVPPAQLGWHRGDDRAAYDSIVHASSTSPGTMGF